MTETKTIRNKYRYSAYAAVATTALAVAASCLAGAPLAGAGGNASLTLSPSTQNVAVGSNLTLNVVVNTGGATTNAIAADINYPSNFSYVRFTDDPAFSTGSLASNKGNTVTFSAGAPGKVTGSHTVGTLTLHADKAGSGNVAFSAICASTGSHCSAVVDPTANYANVLGSVKGGTVTAGGSGSAASGSSNGSGSNSSNPTVAAPAISGVKVVDISESGATITWKTDVPSSSIVNYGTSQQFGLVATTPGLVTSHSVKLGAPEIVKGASYYFTVTSATANGTSATSPAQQFSSTGFDVTLIIKSKSGHAQAGVLVTLNGHSAKTNLQGAATYHDVNAGTGQVVIKAGTKQTKKTVQVGKIDPVTKTYEKQQFTLAAERGNADWIYVLIGGVTLLGLLMIVRPFPPLRRREVLVTPVVTPTVSEAPKPENPQDSPPLNQN